MKEIVGTGTSISTVPVCPGVAVIVLEVRIDPVHVEVMVVVGTGTSISTVPVCPGVAGTMMVVV